MTRSCLLRCTQGSGSLSLQNWATWNLTNIPVMPESERGTKIGSKTKKGLRLVWGCLCLLDSCGFCVSRLFKFLADEELDEVHDSGRNLWRPRFHGPTYQGHPSMVGPSAEPPQPKPAPGTKELGSQRVANGSLEVERFPTTQHVKWMKQIKTMLQAYCSVSNEGD